MSKWLISAAIVALCWQNALQAEMTCGIDHVVIDGVRIPYGTVVEVAGPGCSYRYFKHTSSAIKGLRINGRTNDDDITVELVAAENGNLRVSGGGSYYKVRGLLMDAHDGPVKKFNIIVEQIEAIDPPTIADFVNQPTTLKGIAIAGSRLSLGLGPEHPLLDGLAAWPAGVEGKWVAVRGTVRGEAGAWRIENPQWQFVKLADQIDQPVSLEGRLSWRCFEYGEEKIYLTDVRGRLMTFASGEHERRVRVTGRLARQDRPSLHHRDYKTLPDIVPTFVIRGAEIKFLEAPPKPDRFLYRQPIRIEDGVPLLVPEGYPSGLRGNETKAFFYAGRNHEVIVYILRNATPNACDVMARRMADNEIVAPLRLLYAAVLACLNDDRGRAYLVRNLQDRRSESFLDALYCMGMLEWLRREKLVENAPATDLTWAEKPLISLILDQQKISCKHPSLASLDLQGLAVADAAVYYSYSQIPSVLTAMNSAGARAALLKYIEQIPSERSLPKEADGNGSYPTLHEILTEDVIRAMCWRETQLPVDFLLQLEPLTVGGRGRGYLLVQLLLHKHPAAAGRFLQDLESEYFEIARCICPEFAAALRPHLAELEGGAKACAVILDVLAREDPVPGLLKMLDDAEWPLKRLVVRHLAQLGDSRAVTHVGDILRNAPGDYFSRFDAEYQRWSYGDAADNALDAIAKAGTDDSIRELVGLLDIDLSRFGGYYKRDDYQRSVAGHLIDLTGESFGVDAEKWQSWFNSRDKVEQK